MRRALFVCVHNSVGAVAIDNEVVRLALAREVAHVHHVVPDVQAAPCSDLPCLVDGTRYHIDSVYLVPQLGQETGSGASPTPQFQNSRPFSNIQAWLRLSQEGLEEKSLKSRAPYSSPLDISPLAFIKA